MNDRSSSLAPQLIFYGPATFTALASAMPAEEPKTLYTSQAEPPQNPLARAPPPPTLDFATEHGPCQLRLVSAYIHLGTQTSFHTSVLHHCTSLATKCQGAEKHCVFGRKLLVDKPKFETAVTGLWSVLFHNSCFWPSPAAAVQRRVDARLHFCAGVSHGGCKPSLSDHYVHSVTKHLCRDQHSLGQGETPASSPFPRLSHSPPHHPSLIADAPDALIAMLKPGGSWLFPVQQHLRWLQHVDPDAVTVSDPEDFAPWLTMVQQATHPQHRPTNLGFPQRSTHLTPSRHDVGRRIRPCSRIDNAIRDTHSQYCLMQFWCRSRMMAHLRSSERCCRGMKTPCSPIDSDTRLRRQATTRRDFFFRSDICVFLFRCVVPLDCNAGGPHHTRPSAQPHLRFPSCHRAPTSFVEVRSGCTLIARGVLAMRRLPVSPE